MPVTVPSSGYLIYYIKECYLYSYDGTTRTKVPGVLFPFSAR